VGYAPDFHFCKAEYFQPQGLTRFCKTQVICPSAPNLSHMLHTMGLKCVLLWHMSPAYATARRIMPDQRHVKLFRNGRNQAVRIPVEFELPGDEAIMHRDGDRLIIEPVRKSGLLALLATMSPLDEEFPQINDPVTAPEQIL
jgi:antitoxin VapB